MATDGASGDAARAQTNETANGRRAGLLIDWGGVLTTNLFTSFRDFCVKVGIDPQTLRDRFSKDPSFRELLIALEKGQLDEGEFEQQPAPLLAAAADGQG